MDEVKRLFDRTRDGFVNIAPINGDVLGEIDEIISAGNVTIHIFDIAFMWIENLLGSIFDRCQDHNCRVTIHIPKYMNDYSKWFHELYADRNDIIDIDVFSEPRQFIRNDGSVLTISCDYLIYEYMMSWKLGEEDVYRQNMQVNLYEYDDSCCFANCLMRSYKEIFKSEIIKRFRRNIPEGLQEAFKSDDLVWDYIMQETESEDDYECFTES